MLFAVPLTFLMVIPVILVLFPVALVLYAADEDTWDPIGGGACFLLAYVCLEWLLLVCRDGQTLGKGLMGLRVVRADADTHVQRLSGGPALMRLMVLLTPFALFFIAGSNNGPDNIWGVLAYLGLLSLIASLVLATRSNRQRCTVHISSPEAGLCSHPSAA